VVYVSRLVFWSFQQTDLAVLLPDMSPASAPYRASKPNITLPDPGSSGELNIAPALVDAFLEALSEHAIVLKFYAGPWEAFDVVKLGGAFDLILTSETIYRLESLPSLITLLRACYGPKKPEHDPDTDRDTREDLTSSSALTVRISRMCLVAAKVLYFGVGGGISDFSCAVEEHHGGKVETAWESNKPGVGRKIMSISWE
jgi:protein-histidine N-methyltransferase